MPQKKHKPEEIVAKLRQVDEPPRLCRRPFGLSYAAIAGASSMA